MIPLPLRQHGFLLGLALMVPLAWFFRDAGASGGLLRTEHTVKGGVFLIFLMQGLSLPTEVLRSGLLSWRLHTFVLTWNFLWAPVIVIGLTLVGGAWLDPGFRAGFLFLAILPTTISTAVVFTDAAGGTVPGALFSTTLSNLLGILVVPLWCLVLFSADGISLPAPGPLFAELALLILLPTLLGQLARPWSGALLRRARPFFKPTANAIICFAVFAAFANSFRNAIWDGIGWMATLQWITLTAALLLILTLLVDRTARASFTGLDQEERIAALFCGSQKTLAAGVPMAAVIFGEAQLVVLLIPLLIYHPLQILAGGYLIDRFRATAKLDRR